MINEDTLQQFTVPFNELEHLVLVIKSKTIAHGFMSFDKLLPKLSQMHLFLYSDVDYSFIDCELQYLEHLVLGVSSDAQNRTYQIDALLRKNTQIRYIEIAFFPTDYLKVINVLLPKLENLTLQHLDIGNESIQFEHVKCFTLQSSGLQSLRNLSFPKLEVLSMKFAAPYLNSWIDFFKRHPNISKLHITDTHNPVWNPLLQLSANLPNLNEILIDSLNYIPVDTISEFIERNNKLMSVKIAIFKFNKADGDVLRKKFQHEWDIDDFSTNFQGLSFERKVSG